MSQIAIDKKKRNLLINSVVTQEFPWLLNLLKENEKLDYVDVPEEFKNEFANVVPFVIKNAGEEWKGNEDLLNHVEDLGDDRIRCSLCNTANKLVHYIKNKINGITLNVGSDCINDFVDFEMNQYGKTRKQLIAQAKKTRRMADINKHFNDIDKILDTWERKIEYYDVLIPNAIRQPYLQLGRELSDKYKAYLDLKSSESTFHEIGLMFKEYHIFIESMERYQSEKIDDKFVATKSVVRWLERKGNSAIIDSLKDTGYVDSKTIHTIYEKGFINKIEKDITSLLETLELSVEKVDYEEQEIIMNLNAYSGAVSISCKFHKFMEYFGLMLLDDKSEAVLNIKNLVKISEIFNEKSKYFVVELIDFQFRAIDSRLEFKLNEASSEEIDIIDKTKNQVLILKLNMFLNLVKGYIVEEVTEYKVSKDIYYFLSLQGKRYSIEELEDIRDTSRTMSNRFYSTDQGEWKYQV